MQIYSPNSKMRRRIFQQQQQYSTLFIKMATIEEIRSRVLLTEHGISHVSLENKISYITRRFIFLNYIVQGKVVNQDLGRDLYSSNETFK